jgi:hypothetical protein
MCPIDVPFVFRTWQLKMAPDRFSLFDDPTTRGSDIPFGNQTWQWKIHHLELIFPASHV